MEPTQIALAIRETSCAFGISDDNDRRLAITSKALVGLGAGPTLPKAAQDRHRWALASGRGAGGPEVIELGG